MTDDKTRTLGLAAFAVVLSVMLGCGEKPAPSPKSEPPPTPVSENPGSPKPVPPPSPTPTVPPAAQVDDLLKAKPDFTMTAKQLNDEFKDSSAFLKKYDNKVIEITGPVRMYNSTRELVLGPEINVFLCGEPYAVAKAMPGQTVTLRGRCDTNYGISMWSIVRVEDDPPPTLTAEQLAKEYTADKDGTNNKYRGKYLVLTGAIQKVEKEVGTNIYLTPAGQKPEVTCFFGVLEAQAAEKAGWLKTGQAVRILGSWAGPDPSINTSVALPPAEKP